MVTFINQLLYIRQSQAKGVSLYNCVYSFFHICFGWESRNIVYLTYTYEQNWSCNCWQLSTDEREKWAAYTIGDHHKSNSSHPERTTHKRLWMEGMQLKPSVGILFERKRWYHFLSKLTKQLTNIFLKSWALT